MRLLQEGIGGIKSFDTQTDEFFTEYKTMANAISERRIVDYIFNTIEKAIENNTKGIAIIWIRQVNLDLTIIKEYIKERLSGRNGDRVSHVALRFGVDFIEREEIYTREVILQWR